MAEQVVTDDKTAADWRAAWETFGAAVDWVLDDLPQAVQESVGAFDEAPKKRRRKIDKAMEAMYFDFPAILPTADWLVKFNACRPQSIELPELDKWPEDMPPPPKEPEELWEAFSELAKRQSAKGLAATGLLLQLVVARAYRSYLNSLEEGGD